MLLRTPFCLRVVVVGLLGWVAIHAEVQKPGFNYDEAKVPPYTLPDVLTAGDGSKVTDVKTWETRRRPELLRLFADHMHGRDRKSVV